MSSFNWFLRFRSELPTQKVRKHIAPSIAIPLANQSQRHYHLTPAPDYSSFAISKGTAPLLRCRLEEWQLRRCYHAVYDHPIPEICPLGFLDSTQSLPVRSYHAGYGQQVIQQQTYYPALLGPLGSLVNPSMMSERCYHVQSPQQQAQNSLDYNKIGYYMPGGGSEDLRMKMKSATAKKAMKPEKSQAEDTQSKKSKTESLVSNAGKMERARLETAREFVNLNPGSDRDDLNEEPMKVACPKPNLESPYLNTSEDADGDEAPSLRSHYKKVLQQPDRHMGVFFHRPRQKSFTYKTHMKPRKFAQYYMINQNQSFSLYAPLSATICIRKLHSDSFVTSKNSDTTICNNYAYLKSTTEHPKRVDTVKMEIVKLEKTPRKAERITDINSELWRVLGEALAQGKECHQRPIEPPEQIHHEKMFKTKTKVVSNSSKKGVDVLVTACLEMKPSNARTQPKEVVLDTTKMATSQKPALECSKHVPVVGSSSDGKHCYNILYSSSRSMKHMGASTQGKTMVLDKVGTKNMSSNLKNCPAKDFSETFTDLSDYDDGSDGQVSDSSATHEDLVPAVNLPNADFNKEVDIKLTARRQHNQRVVQVIEDFSNIQTF